MSFTAKTEVKVLEQRSTLADQLIEFWPFNNLIKKEEVKAFLVSKYIVREEDQNETLFI